MISELNIENIALIEKLSLNFYNGLNILSGETGAGKSIIIDSLNFVLGERADKSLIRYGSNYASVEIVFSDYLNEKISAYLNEVGIEIDDILILKRKMSLEGKNECRINGKQVTLSVLKNLTSLICDIHGQHEHQSLLDVNSHIDLLDNFGNLSTLKNEVAASHAKYNKIKRELLKFGDNQNRERKIDILKFQIDEIEKAAIFDGEEDEILEKRKKIRNIEKIQNAYAETLNNLDGNFSVVENLKTAKYYLDSISNFESGLSELSSRLETTRIEIKDIIEEIESYKDKLEFDSKEAEQIEQRLELIRTIFRKYGGSFTLTQKFLEKSKEEYNELINADEKVEQLNKQLKMETEIFASNLTALTNARQQTAKDFENKIVKELDSLGMKGTTFVVSFKLLSIDESTANGADEVEFLISPNVGEPLKPLQKIISGGEMSRFMLALKNIISKIDNIQTMVFDEIDTGISGHIAEVVAQKLCNISREKQVLAVTHLPQLASMADTHFKIEKYVENDKTYTKLTKLDDSNSELARLIGGAEYSEFATKHAIEMKQWATNYKLSLK